MNANLADLVFTYGRPNTQKDIDCSRVNKDSPLISWAGQGPWKV